ncbi:hypothetical protein [Streptomyces sp. NPDC045251]|uniref:hypothetical protein n=1 Tax=unclassified Streptomyces TaxID=2593676 RepID=UPI0033C332C7
MAVAKPATRRVPFCSVPGASPTAVAGLHRASIRGIMVSFEETPAERRTVAADDVGVCRRAVCRHVPVRVPGG